ncbi:hypothetical protein [Lunatibacter salilacus]|uniref:hypothetical protein n=1 Tax=Lunatibacter salilacus TaxID=2483804 RepID=UPI001F1EB2D0|nr:hypothetical protein [Lunatibacter salilacus]
MPLSTHSGIHLPHNFWNRALTSGSSRYFWGQIPENDLGLPACDQLRSLEDQKSPGWAVMETANIRNGGAELSDILESQKENFLGSGKLCADQANAYNDILDCRTAKMGSHTLTCVHLWRKQVKLQQLP